MNTQTSSYLALQDLKPRTGYLVSACASGLFTGWDGRSWKSNCFDKHGVVWKELVWLCGAKHAPIKKHQRPASTLTAIKVENYRCCCGIKKIEQSATRWCLKWKTEMGSLQCHVCSVSKALLNVILFLFVSCLWYLLTRKKKAQWSHKGIWWRNIQGRAL